MNPVPTSTDVVNNLVSPDQQAKDKGPLSFWALYCLVLH